MNLENHNSKTQFTPSINHKNDLFLILIDAMKYLQMEFKDDNIYMSL